MKKQIILLLCIVVASLPACDQVRKVKEEAYKTAQRFLPGNLFSPEKKKSKKEKTKEKKDDPAAGAPAEAAPAVPAQAAPAPIDAPEAPLPAEVSPPVPDPATEVTIPAPAEAAPPLAAATDYKPAPLAPETVSPVNVTDVFGGAVTAVGVSPSQFYVGMGRKLMVHDAQLNLQGSLILKNEIREITPLTTEAETYLFVEEDAFVLEIVKLASGAKPQVVLSFKADGPVEGPFEVMTGSVKTHQLLVALSDKVQILDVGNLQAIKVLSEPAVTQATQVWPVGGFLYVARGKTLQVVNAGTGAVLASVPVDADFKILGLREEGGALNLLAALKSATTGKWQTIQYIPLVAGGGGVQDLGQGVEIVGGADDVAYDSSKPQIVFVREGKPGLFDVLKKGEVPVAPVALSPLKTARMSQGVFYAVGSSGYGRYELEIPPEAPAATAPPPTAGLAQAPAPTAHWINEKIIHYPTSVEAVALPGSDLLLVAGGQPLSVHSSLYAAPSFSSGISALQPIAAPVASPPRYTLVRTGGAGTYFYDEAAHKIILVRKDLSTDWFDLGGITATGLDVFPDARGDIFYVTGSKGGPASVFALAPGASHDVKMLATLQLDEASGIKLFDKGRRALVGCGARGACALDLDSAKPNMKVLTTLAPVHKDARVTEVSLSPDENLAYLFFESASGKIISIVSLKAAPPAEVGVIPQVAVDRIQFGRLSFSAGGQKLLLPGDNGLNVYDMKNPKAPTLSFSWPVGKVMGVDVTGRGKIVCAALGGKGAVCGQLQ